jgi:hypothetical protein
LEFDHYADLLGAIELLMRGFYLQKGDGSAGVSVWKPDTSTQKVVYTYDGIRMEFEAKRLDTARKY